jgi:hypothetical protein
MMKMTRDLLENAEQIKKDARALYEAGERYDGLGVTNRFITYFDEHYEFDTVEDDSLFGGEVPTDEQLDVYNKYTKMVRHEIRNIQLNR